eukprot:43414_1
METGQTATIKGGADYSKLNFMNGLEEVIVKQPFDGKDCCLMILPDIIDCICEEIPVVGNFWEIISGCLWGCCEGKASYEVHNKKKVQLFNLQEGSNWCARKCCNVAKRSMVLNASLPDSDDDIPLFSIKQPYRLDCCCCSPKCGCMGRNIMKVYVGDCMIGSIQKNCSCYWRMSYSVHDQNDNLLVTIERCKCFCKCGGLKFDIVTPDGNKTGKTISQLSACCNPNDPFLVNFPKCMSTLQHKILLIAASMMME